MVRAHLAEAEAGGRAELTFDAELLTISGALSCVELQASPDICYLPDAFVALTYANS